MLRKDMLGGTQVMVEVECERYQRFVLSDVVESVIEAVAGQVGK